MISLGVFHTNRHADQTVIDAGGVTLFLRHVLVGNGAWGAYKSCGWCQRSPRVPPDRRCSLPLAAPSIPPGTTNDNNPPSSFIWPMRQLVLRVTLQTGVIDVFYLGMPGQKFGQLFGHCCCDACIRMDNVSRYCKVSQASKGWRMAPTNSVVFHRMSSTKASGPITTPPQYGGVAGQEFCERQHHDIRAHFHRLLKRGGSPLYYPPTPARRVREPRPLPQQYR